ncbi:ATP-binding cassette domain-containing protein [Streptomyces sp. NPDC002795]|uniref:ATP-binding cassette domain-containing protein n=1 Tax=Streptomyces sp. NPDC002795 TaxID=3364665 RepID=UPI00369E5992
MIEARGLTERYGGTVAVEDLSFRVRPGSVTGLLGPNGSGKPTTLRMIMGLGIGAITRHTASAIGVLVGITYVLPALLAGTTGTAVAEFFPTMISGNSPAVTVPVDGMLSPWAGFGVLCLCTAAFLAVGDRLPARRDA